MNILQRIEEFGDNMRRSMGYIGLIEWDWSTPDPKIPQEIADAYANMKTLEQDIYAAFAVPAHLFDDVKGSVNDRP